MASQLAHTNKHSVTKHTDKTIRDYGIVNESTIHIVARLRGGRGGWIKMSESSGQAREVSVDLGSLGTLRCSRTAFLVGLCIALFVCSALIFYVFFS